MAEQGEYSSDEGEEEAEEIVFTPELNPEDQPSPESPDAFDRIVFTPEGSPGSGDPVEEISPESSVELGGEGGPAGMPDPVRRLSFRGGGGGGGGGMRDPSRQLDFESGGFSLFGGDSDSDGGDDEYGFNLFSSGAPAGFDDDEMEDAAQGADLEQTFISPTAQIDTNGDLWVTFRDARTNRAVTVSLDGQSVHQRHFGAPRWHTLPPKELNDRMPTKRPVYELERVLLEDIGFSKQIIASVSLWDLVTRGASASSRDRDVQEYLLRTAAKIRRLARLMQRHKYPDLPLDRTVLRQKYRAMADTRLANEYSGLADGKARDILLGGTRAELNAFFTTENEVTDYERYAETRTLSQLRALQGRLMALARGPGDEENMRAIKTLFVEDLREESIFSRDRQPDALDGTGEWTQQNIGPLMITLPNGKRERILELERRRVDLSRRVHNKVSVEEEELLAVREDILRMFHVYGLTHPRAGLMRSRLDDVEARLEVLRLGRTSFVQARAELQQQITNVNARIEALTLDVDAPDFRDGLVLAIATADARVRALEAVIVREIDPSGDARTRAEIEELARTTRTNRAGARLNLVTLRNLLSYYDDMVRLYWSMRESDEDMASGVAATRMYTERKHYADELDDVDAQLRILRSSGPQHDIIYTNLHSADVSVNRGLGEAPLDVTNEYMRRASGMTRVGTERPMSRDDLVGAESDGPAEFLGRDPSRDWGLVPVPRESINYPAERALEWECCGQIGVEAPGCWTGLPDPMQTLLVPSRFYDPRAFPSVEDIALGRVTRAGLAEVWKAGVQLGSAWCPPGGVTVEDHLSRHDRIVELNDQIADAVAEMAMQAVLAESISVIEFTPRVLGVFKELYLLTKLQNHAFNLESDARIPLPSASDATWKDFIAKDVFLADLVPCVMRQEPRSLIETCMFPAPLGEVQLRLLPTTLPVTPADFRVSVISIRNLARRVAGLPGPLDSEMPLSTWNLLVRLLDTAVSVSPVLGAYRTALDAYFSVPGAHSEFTTSGAEVARMDQLARLVGNSDTSAEAEIQAAAVELVRQWTRWREDATRQVTAALARLARGYNNVVREIFCTPEVFSYASLRMVAAALADDEDFPFDDGDDVDGALEALIADTARSVGRDTTELDAVEGSVDALRAQAQALFDRYQPEYRAAILRARLNAAEVAPTGRADRPREERRGIPYLGFDTLEDEAASSRDPDVRNTVVVTPETRVIPLRFRSEMPLVIGARTKGSQQRRGGGGGGGGRRQFTPAQLPVYTCGMSTHTEEESRPEEREQGVPATVGFAQLTLARAADRAVFASAVTPLRLVDLRRQVKGEAPPLNAAFAGVDPRLAQRVTIDRDLTPMRALDFMVQMLDVYINRPGASVDIGDGVTLNTFKMFTEGTGGNPARLISAQPDKTEITLTDTPSRSFKTNTASAVKPENAAALFTWDLDRVEFNFLTLFRKLILGESIGGSAGINTPLMVPDDDRARYPERYAVWKIIRRFAGYVGVYGENGNIADSVGFADDVGVPDAVFSTEFNTVAQTVKTTRVSQNSNTLFIGGRDPGRGGGTLAWMGIGVGWVFLARQLLYTLENWRRFARFLQHALDPNPDITVESIEVMSRDPRVAPVTFPWMTAAFRQLDARQHAKLDQLEFQLRRMEGGGGPGGAMRLPADLDPQRERLALNEILRQYAMLLTQATSAYEAGNPDEEPIQTATIPADHPFVVQRNALERMGGGSSITTGSSFPTVGVFTTCMFAISRALGITRRYPSLREALLVYTTGLYLSDGGFMRAKVVIRDPASTFSPPPAKSLSSPPNSVELAPARTSGRSEIVDYAPLTAWYFQVFTDFGEFLRSFVEDDAARDRVMTTDALAADLRGRIEPDVVEKQAELAALWKSAADAFGVATGTIQRTEAKDATYILAGEPLVFLLLARGIMVVRQIATRDLAMTYLVRTIDSRPSGDRGLPTATAVLQFIRDSVYRTLSSDQKLAATALLKQLHVIQDGATADDPSTWLTGFYVRDDWKDFVGNQYPKGRTQQISDPATIYINNHTEMYRVYAYLNLLFSVVYVMVSGSSLADSNKWVEGVTKLPDIHGRWVFGDTGRKPLGPYALKQTLVPRRPATDPVVLLLSIRQARGLMPDYAKGRLVQEARTVAEAAWEQSQSSGWLGGLFSSGTGSASKSQASRGWLMSDVYVTMDRVNALLAHAIYTSIESMLGEERLLGQIAEKGVVTYYSAAQYERYYMKSVYTEELLTSYALALRAVLDQDSQVDAVLISTHEIGRGKDVRVPDPLKYSVVSPGWGNVQRNVLYRVARATGILWGQNVWTTRVTFTPTKPGKGTLYIPKDRMQIQNLLASWAIFAKLIMMVGDRGLKIGASPKYSMIEGQREPLDAGLGIRDLVPEVSEAALVQYLRTIGPISAANDVEIVGKGASARWVPLYESYAGTVDEDLPEAGKQRLTAEYLGRGDARGGPRDNLIARIEADVGPLEDMPNFWTARNADPTWGKREEEEEEEDAALQQEGETRLRKKTDEEKMRAVEAESAAAALRLKRTRWTERRDEWVAQGNDARDFLEPYPGTTAPSPPKGKRGGISFQGDPPAKTQPSPSKQVRRGKRLPGEDEGLNYEDATEEFRLSMDPDASLARLVGYRRPSRKALYVQNWSSLEYTRLVFGEARVNGGAPPYRSLFDTTPAGISAYRKPAYVHRFFFPFRATDLDSEIKRFLDAGLMNEEWRQMIYPEEQRVSKKKTVTVAVPDAVAWRETTQQISALWIHNGFGAVGMLSADQQKELIPMAMLAGLIGVAKTLDGVGVDSSGQDGVLAVMPWYGSREDPRENEFMPPLSVDAVVSVQAMRAQMTLMGMFLQIVGYRISPTWLRPVYIKLKTRFYNYYDKKVRPFYAYKKLRYKLNGRPIPYITAALKKAFIDAARSLAEARSSTSGSDGGGGGGGRPPVSPSPGRSPPAEQQQLEQDRGYEPEDPRPLKEQYARDVRAVLTTEGVRGLTLPIKYPVGVFRECEIYNDLKWAAEQLAGNGWRNYQDTDGSIYWDVLNRAPTNGAVVNRGGSDRWVAPADASADRSLDVGGPIYLITRYYNQELARMESREDSKKTTFKPLGDLRKRALSSVARLIGLEAADGNTVTGWAPRQSRGMFAVMPETSLELTNLRAAWANFAVMLEVISLPYYKTKANQVSASTTRAALPDEEIARYVDARYEIEQRFGRLGDAARGTSTELVRIMQPLIGGLIPIETDGDIFVVDGDGHHHDEDVDTQYDITAWGNE